MDTPGLDTGRVGWRLRNLEHKGRVARTASIGRGVAVRPTELAADNLRGLCTAWGRELTGVPATTSRLSRRCADFLNRLQQRLTADDLAAAIHPTRR